MGGQKLKVVLVETDAANDHLVALAFRSRLFALTCGGCESSSQWLWLRGEGVGPTPNIAFRFARRRAGSPRGHTLFCLQVELASVRVKVMNGRMGGWWRRCCPLPRGHLGPEVCLGFWREKMAAAKVMDGWPGVALTCNPVTAHEEGSFVASVPPFALDLAKLGVTTP